MSDDLLTCEFLSSEGTYCVTITYVSFISCLCEYSIHGGLSCVFWYIVLINLFYIMQFINVLLLPHISPLQ